MEVVESLLIGNYKIIQDTKLYRFTSDSVLLARFAKAKRGERVADFCSGSGIVGLHFFAENKGVERVTLFEMQSELAQMSERTIQMNGLETYFNVENVRIQDIPEKYIEFFSLILCNPPYAREGFESEERRKAVCKKELSLTLEELCRAAKRNLKFGGRFVLIHRADRIAEIIVALKNNNLEPKKMQLIAGKPGAKPYAVLLLAVKGGKESVEVLPTAINRSAGEIE